MNVEVLACPAGVTRTRHVVGVPEPQSPCALNCVESASTTPFGLFGSVITEVVTPPMIFRPSVCGSSGS